ncbi:MAG: serine hydrolase [Bacteroidia bacterium]|nr:serine hydrolase [Bacteroidia bacterium]
MIYKVIGKYKELKNLLSKKGHIITYILLITLYVVCLVHQSSAQSNISVDTTLRKILAQHGNKLTGMEVAVVQHGKVLYSKGFGYSDRASKMLCTDATMMEVASLSKAMVGLAIARLVEMDLCTLDSPINKMLPFAVVNPYALAEAITLRHVVTHTSGIHDAPQFFIHTMQYTDYKDPDIPLTNFVANFLSPTGKWYSKHSFNKRGAKPYPVDYSNLNAALAALVVEYLTGISFEQFTQQHIFNKAGMQHTGWFFKQLTGKHLAQKYMANGLRLRHYTIRSYPSSTLYTTATDISKLLCMLTAQNNNTAFGNGSTLSLVCDDRNNMYEYGIFWKRYGKAYGSTGMNLGIDARLRINPRSGTGYVIMFNQTLNKRNTRLRNAVAEYLDGVGR